MKKKRGEGRKERVKIGNGPTFLANERKLLISYSRGNLFLSGLLSRDSLSFSPTMHPSWHTLASIVPSNLENLPTHRA